MKKLLFIVVDGGAGRPIKSLGNKTPFEASDSPNLDYIARNGINGIMQILPIPPESDEAVLSLLGFDVFESHTGRGPLEAIGAGVPFKDGDLALRCNFAYVKGDDIIDIRAGNIPSNEAKKFEWDLNEKIELHGVKFRFKSTVGYRGVLVIEKPNGSLSAKISNTHPGYHLENFETLWNRYGESKSIPLSIANEKPVMKMKSVTPLEHTKKAALSANLVNEFIQKSRLVLEKHKTNLKRMSEKKLPANIVLTRDAGNKVPRLADFKEVYDMRWASFADMPVEKGIAQLCGMDTIPLPQLSAETAEADMEEDMKIRLNTLLRNLQLYDAFYIHLKGPDPYGHRGEPRGKVKAIESIDKYFLGPLFEYLDMENTIIVITCDHSTPCELKAHSADPVPVAVFGSGLTPDTSSVFSEASCAKGSLGKLSAMSLMPYLVKLAKGNIDEL